LLANDLHYKPTDNKIRGSILWNIDVPDDIARELSSRNGGDMVMNVFLYNISLS
jgi:hypothetical protein